MVDLPPDLANVFGKPRLYLVFPTGDGTMRELSPGEDLLVYGSRTFDQMLDLLASRGEIAQLRLPNRFALETDAPSTLPFSLYNCHLLENQIHTAYEQFYTFNFRAIYRSTEKQEILVMVVLNSDGQPRPDLVSLLTDIDTALPADSPLSTDPEKLQILLDYASETAHQQADAHAAEMEKAILPRLEKILLRLTTYYRRLQDEIDTGDAEQDEIVRADLQSDLDRQIAEELERHRLRVTLSPISYAIISIPFAHHQLAVATHHTQQSVNFAQNLYTGLIEGLACHHCQEPIDQLALCDHQHIVHSHCLDICHHCSRDICHTCGIQACAVCDHSVCTDCIATCDHCERWLCAQHVETCAICSAHYCPAHSFRCRWCGQVYCIRCGVSECQTCRAALTSLTTEVLPARMDVARLKLDRYRWKHAENEVYVIHIGYPRGPISPLLSRLIIVTDKTGQIVSRQKIGALPWLFKRPKS